MPWPLTAAGKKRSPEEAEIVPRDDGAKRKERTGSARVAKKGPKVRLVLVLPFHSCSNCSCQRTGCFGITVQSTRSPTARQCDAHTTQRRRGERPVRRRRFRFP